MKMEFEKANFQSKVSANKRISKTDKIEAIWAKETNNKPTIKPNEATHETLTCFTGSVIQELGKIKPGCRKTRTNG